MRLSVVLATAFLSGPCSGSSGEAPSEPAKAATTASATATAAAASAAVPALSASTAVTTAAAVPTITAPPHGSGGPAPSAGPAPANGPCAALAQKCKACPPGVVQIACTTALTAGTVNPTACTNALNDPSIQSQCGGSTPPKPPTSGATVTPPSPPPPSGTGPCADLSKKCAKCPAGVVKMACTGAVAAGALDQTACTNALADKNIQSQCN